MHAAPHDMQFLYISPQPFFKFDAGPNSQEQNNHATQNSLLVMQSCQRVQAAGSDHCVTTALHGTAA